MNNKNMPSGYKQLFSLIEKMTGKSFPKQETSSQYLISIVEYYDALIAPMPGHVYWLNRNNIYLGCNDNQAKSAGLKSREEIIGKRNADLPWNMHSSMLPEMLDEMNEEVMSSGIPKDIEEPGTLHSGEQIFFLSHKVPLKTKNGTVIGLLGISIDITEKVSLREKLEKANADKIEFMETVNRIIRSLLNPVISGAQILEKTKLDEKQIEIVTAIQSSAEKIVPTLDRINYYTEIERGEYETVDHVFNLKNLISKKVNIHKKECEESHSEIKLVYDESIPNWLEGNLNFLSQILSNVISNAAKYTKNGEINILVKKESFEFNRVNISIIIKDTGLGIPKKKLSDLLITPSKENTQEDKFKKPGINLSISKKMLEKMEGEIDIVSNEGEGTTVKIKLPLKISERQDFTRDHDYAVQSDENDKLTKVKRKINVMCVEDEALSQKMMSYIISKEFNASIYFCNSIAEAKEHMTDQYDIILLDMNLPDASGIELLKYIKKTGKNIDTPVISITAYATEEERQLIIEEGAKDLLIKPVDYNNLVNIINYYATQ